MELYKVYVEENSAEVFIKNYNNKNTTLSSSNQNC